MRSVIFVSAVGAIAVAASFASGVRAEVSAAAGSSSACFNQGLYAKGAVVDYDTKISGDGEAMTFRSVNTGKGGATFNGVDALRVDTETFDAKGKSEGVIAGYFDITPDFLLIIASKSKDSETTYDPAGRQPINQSEGDTYKQKYEVTTTTKGAGSLTSSRQATWKFVGVESLKSKVGKFKVCKIIAKFVDKFGGFSTTSTQTIYVAAEGKYRGFALRTKMATKLATGQSLNTTTDVVKFRKFAPK
ncbi:hypothetical protein IHQ68_00350 [Chelatococcus sambhunathii]|uniref:Uncharacterized protein n=1 Tax=Chelatococcus sambhunathii TaxID=363953 RepID=A0ABU1DAE8_9HYPH|nr:hypothetical protein [Chelatococcus sambhunathii]MDR4305077.1 hypothetical protein [Chelatococcus sambhunathii]